MVEKLLVERLFTMDGQYVKVAKSHVYKREVRHFYRITIPKMSCHLFKSISCSNFANIKERHHVNMMEEVQ